MGAREYYDYRRAIYGDITHKAILVDVAGTLLAPTEPMAQVYRTIGEKYGVKYSEDEILMRYRRANKDPIQRYVGALETCRHLFLQCSFPELVWGILRQRLQNALQLDGDLDLGMWWAASCKPLDKDRRCVFDTAVTLIA
ncbi:hypothetical protein E2562_024265 [Oryza meyeriana var. granulata]|uniref:Haloacid dehalogenase-like hydrolase n=1 Tax=Oryza meyeriana var. granulata TaxID=110450 RepID=A0A6G1E1X5_9ORYZ|nr:hypothetical protein E2562_024265 [Oryza meyeriana var. granulata]